MDTPKKPRVKKDKDTIHSGYFKEIRMVLLLKAKKNHHPQFGPALKHLVQQTQPGEILRENMFGIGGLKENGTIRLPQRHSCSARALPCSSAQACTQGHMFCFQCALMSEAPWLKKKQNQLSPVQVRQTKCDISR